MEAEVDEEDEGDEEDEDGQADPFIADTHPDDEAALPIGAETDDRRHRELDRQREKDLQMDAEKQAKILKERYSNKRSQASGAATLSKRHLLPTGEDPSIWAVACKPGKELEVIPQIKRKVDEMRNMGNETSIISVFARKVHSSGFIYLEARRVDDVTQCVKGQAFVYPRKNMFVVSINETPQLLRVNKRKKLPLGAFVEIARGKYKGDIAQIDDVDPNGHDATLRIVPRLDYGLNEESNPSDGVPKDQMPKRKRQGAKAIRPPQRLFSDLDARKKNIKYLKSNSSLGKRHWEYHGDTYINGYLIKEFKVAHLNTRNIKPSLEEIAKFTEGGQDETENLDLSSLLANAKSNISGKDFMPGEMVEVYEGKQQGWYGRIVSVHGDFATVHVGNGDLEGQNIDIPVKGLRKRFAPGDHVKVTGNTRHMDEVGMVVHVKDENVTFVSDLSFQEITLFGKDLRETTASGVTGGHGRYKIHTLVQLDVSTVGCVLEVDRERIRILDQHGSTKSIKPSEITNLISPRRGTVATDRNGSEIRVGDVVRESGGEQKQGEIKHIYRSYLFIHDRTQAHDSGISVVRSNNVATTAARGGRVGPGGSNGIDTTKMNPALQRNGANSHGKSMGPPNAVNRWDLAYGQRCIVRKGPYKGLLGFLVSHRDQIATLELDGSSSKLEVLKDAIGFADAMSEKTREYYPIERMILGRGRARVGPAVQPRIPEWTGSRTPGGVAQGGRTPAWAVANSSSRTPAWRPDGPTGNRTPAYGGGDGGRTVNPYADGNRTAYGGAIGAGGRTPAWDPGARTSYGDPFGGSRTPAWAPESSRTPAHTSTSAADVDPWASSSRLTSSNTAANSRPYDAPTPGQDIYAAPTPSNVYSAPTPVATDATPKFTAYAADAPTPFSGQPETPAAWVGEEGPRYEEGTPSP